MVAVRVSVPAKIILSGEHSVVYGHPALISSINKRLGITIEKVKSKNITINDQRYGTKTLSQNDTLNYWQRAENSWQKFNKTKDIKKLSWIKDDNLALVVLAVAEALKQYKLDFGIKIAVNSQIPAGTGLGSSAAISAGVIAGLMVLIIGKIDKKEVFKYSWKVEQKQHGWSSGADPAAVVFGGCLVYQKEKGITKIKAPKLPAFYRITSGQPIESTGEMVALVKTTYDQNHHHYTKILKSMADVTSRFIAVAKQENNDDLREILNQNEELLEKLGVVGSRAKKIITDIKKIGGAAKICGAGGAKKGSGAILVYHPDQGKIIQHFTANKIAYELIKADHRGVYVQTS
jgi:mevalonate kinase